MIFSKKCGFSSQLTHTNQMDEFISNFSVAGWYFSFLFNLKKKKNFCKQTVEIANRIPWQDKVPNHKLGLSD